MRTRFKNILPVFLFFLMLVCPQAVFSGASKGLMLWFEVVLPTLYPFLLLSGFLLVTGNLEFISSLLGGICSRLFGVSRNGSFVVLTGFLCGYPMGAKTAADLFESGHISREEGRYLLSFCNNTSPSFILNFLVLQTIGNRTLLLPTFAILMAAPVLVSLFTRRLYHFDATCPPRPPRGGTKARTRGGNWNFQEIDACIMNSFETLVKVGGYIMLFSVIISLLQMADTPTWLDCALSLLEVTNGLAMLKALHLPLALSYPLMLGLAAFGGLCAAAQTQCMVQKAGFPMTPYLMQKLAAALTASLLGILYLLAC